MIRIASAAGAVLFALISLPAVAAGDLSASPRLGRLFMVVIDEAGAERYEAYIRDGRLGGGLLKWDAFDAPSLRRFTRRLQEIAGPHAPFLVAVDHEGGPLFTQRSFGASIFPGNMALGAAGDPELARGAAETSARELRALGIHINFAPVLDVNSDPKNPIIGVRSFGEDPAAVSRLGAAAIRGYVEGGVIPAAKHFPGHGDTGVDSHTGLPVIEKTRESIEGVDLVPFRAAVTAGVPMIMPAHISVPSLGTGGLPVTLSSGVLMGLLRERIGFDGVIVSDSLDMAAVSRGPVPLNPGETAVRAFLAGCDILLLGKADFPRVLAAFEAAVASGRIPSARVEESLGRIERLAALIEARNGGRGAGTPVRPAEVAEASVTLARGSAAKAAETIKASKRPFVAAFSGSRTAAAVRAFADEIVSRAGGGAVVVAAADPSAADAELMAAEARKADALVIGSYLWGGTPPRAQRELIRRLLSLGKPAVLVSLMNPYDAPYYPEAETVLLIYGPTEASLSAAVRALFGELVPRGRPPVTLGP